MASRLNLSKILAGRDCLSVTLQNERGGRQRCFAIDASAGQDDTDPVRESGISYFEKICTSEDGKAVSSGFRDA